MKALPEQMHTCQLVLQPTKTKLLLTLGLLQYNDQSGCCLGQRQTFQLLDQVVVLHL
jgi:hypothetical protein